MSLVQRTGEVELGLALGDRAQRWLIARPGRVASVTGSALLVGGTFTVLYWVLRMLGNAGIRWYPIVRW